ncbi:MAG: hypothetical protein LLG03_12730 [Planctomycetaceae bacterium]|nr:hypothetical protein [Planctomycetaceae bacterium]
MRVCLLLALGCLSLAAQAQPGPVPQDLQQLYTSLYGMLATGDETRECWKLGQWG